MDWTKFPEAIVDPRFMGGQPVFRTEPRMPIQTVIDNLDEGLTPQEIANAYNLDLRLVAGVKRFLESQTVARPV